MPKASLSTHVLDTTAGAPAAGVRIELVHEGRTIASGVTDVDGRIRELAQGLVPGTYRLVFDTRTYGADAFFSRVALDIDLQDGHTHVPLLLSRYGVTAYRGS
jgi:5-hydroxyisourate hydrolase